MTRRLEYPPYLVAPGQGVKTGKGRVGGLGRIIEDVCDTFHARAEGSSGSQGIVARSPAQAFVVGVAGAIVVVWLIKFVVHMAGTAKAIGTPSVAVGKVQNLRQMDPTECHSSW